MAKDVVRTLMEIAGHGSEFGDYYSDKFFIGEEETDKENDPAHVIKQLVSNSMARAAASRS